MDKKTEKRTTITFDCGSKELKDKAIQLAKNFKPVRISLSSICQIALMNYIKENVVKEEREKNNERI